MAEDLGEAKPPDEPKPPDLPKPTEHESRSAADDHGAPQDTHESAQQDTRRAVEAEFAKATERGEPEQTQPAPEAGRAAAGEVAATERAEVDEARQPPETPVDRLGAMEQTDKVSGDVANLRERLQSEDRATRIGAEAELVEIEREVAGGDSPVIRGAEAGTDQPTYEVKARTEPFTSQKNAQNFFSDRIKAANDQFVKGETRGDVRINLGDQTEIQDAPLTSEKLAGMVDRSLSKGGRGTNITKVMITSADGTVLYEGLGSQS